MKTSKKPVVPFNNLYEGIYPDAHRMTQVFKDVLESGQYILGKRVRDFEIEFSDYTGLQYGVGVASGTDAITTALAACGIGDMDTVLTVANSAPATVTAIKSTGARVRFVDVDERGLFDPAHLEDKRMMEGVKAIVPVHLYGRIAHIEKMAPIAEKHSISIIEDACQAAGSTSSYYRIGSLSSAVCYSFYPTKNLGCIGDGGMVLTNKKEISERIRLARNYGLHEGKQLFYGYNSRLDELQAAMLSIRLGSLKKINDNRRAVGASYFRKLHNMKYIKASEVLDGENVHLYPIHSDERDHLKTFLETEGIQTMIHYPIPAHRQPVEKDYYFPYSLKKTEDHCRTVLSLPCWYGMKEHQVDIVVRAIRRFFNE